MSDRGRRPPEARRTASWAWAATWGLAVGALAAADPAFGETSHGGAGVEIPPPLASYGDAGVDGIAATLAGRIRAEPFNLVATAIFACAILHTFLSSRFLALAARARAAHETRLASGDAPRGSTSGSAELLHFLGEVEVVFGLWAAVLGAAMVWRFDWATFVHYLDEGVYFGEAMFVVVIMTLASTRPILRLAETVMGRVAGVLGGALTVWWFTVLTLGPLLSSVITEPAAMTIAAMLLARRFYPLEPSEAFKYGTLGLLFVNVSVGGTLTHFAAPPVLMVADAWGWDTPFMLAHFGVAAVVGILICNGLYYLGFRREFALLQERFVAESLKEEIRQRHVPRAFVEGRIDAFLRELRDELRIDGRVREISDAQVEYVRENVEPALLAEVKTRGIDPDLALLVLRERFEEVRLARIREAVPFVLPPEQRPTFVDPDWDTRDDPVPVWVIAVHVVFLGWTVVNAHHPALFVAGLLFFLGFAAVSAQHQNRIDLRAPLLVGFFLAGLVIHGGLQGWWIQPVLGSLGELPLMMTATLLTAFNDNAAITYLTTLIPDLPDALKHAAVAGAVAGGGLTVIANAPNPAGQALLKGFFEHGVSPIKLLAAAALPTAVVFSCFALLGG